MHCSEDDCTEPVLVKKFQLCSRHYYQRRARMKRGGEYRTGYPRPARPAQERFWEKVNKDGPIPELHPELGKCWVWEASKKKSGYGVFRAGYGESATQAHRHSYEWEVGKIPENLQLDHLCHNRSCVRPSHLVPVTGKMNMAHTKAHCTALAELRTATK